MQKNKYIHQLFDNQFIELNHLDPQLLIQKITSDSREVEKNTLFLACQGTFINGANFIDSAIKQGASLVLSESEYLVNSSIKTPVILMPNLKDILSNLFASFYGVNLNLITNIGVTGTNGKTSVAHILAQALNSIYVGTIGVGKVDKLEETQNTTPSIEKIMPTLLSCQEEGTSHCVLEISSHALEQKRLLNFPIKTAVFTNLSHDHLDYHGTMQDYANSKFALFLEYKISNAVISIDDKWGQALITKLPDAVNFLTFGMKENANIYPSSIFSSIDGTQVVLNTPKGNVDFQLPLIGDFNVLNVMAMIGVLIFEGWTLANIILKVESLVCISGRMEVINKSPTFIVDYAHTPDALEKALIALRPICKGRLWCVFGCGGDRDITKRPLMGAIVEKFSDRMIITNDNPRSEQPESIVNDIVKGIKQIEKVTTILDRDEALVFCKNHAAPNDIILVAGKGHEEYQVIGTEKFYFSDQSSIKNLYMEVTK